MYAVIMHSCTSSLVVRMRISFSVVDSIVCLVLNNFLIYYMYNVLPILVLVQLLSPKAITYLQTSVESALSFKLMVNHSQPCYMYLFHYHKIPSIMFELMQLQTMDPTGFHNFPSIQLTFPSPRYRSSK